jgi:hypothetical protein
MEGEPNKTEIKRNDDGTFAEGTAPGPGRPKGQTLKEWMRDKLLCMTEDQREEFIKDIPKEMRWKMAEGNPHNTEDITSGGKPIPLLTALPKEDVSNNNSNKEGSQTEEKN